MSALLTEALPSTDAVAKTRCLIVEDQALIGMSIEAYLEDMGFEVGGPISSCAEACAWLDANTPRFALIDFKLKDGVATPLARKLREQGVPFVVYSGLPRLRDLPPEFDGAPWIEKPIARENLVRALATLMPNG
jgi:DNA-binding response OmpR family regulator